MVVEEATRNARQLRTTVAMRGTDERDSYELWAAWMIRAFPHCSLSVASLRVWASRDGIGDDGDGNLPQFPGLE